MTATPQHISWLKDTGIEIVTSNGRTARLIEFQHISEDYAILSAWAKHFREHYCLDTKIDELRNGTGLSRAEYLKAIKFPDAGQPPGPSVRAGDFAEILVADYFEFLLNYIVPRTRYHDKFPNESEKGTDVLAFQLVSPEPWSPNDILFCVEVKAQFSGDKTKPCLQTAVTDSIKDQYRKAASLNAMKQRLKQRGDMYTAQIVERFQNLKDKPYKDFYAAAAFHCNSNYDEAVVKATVTNDHPNKNNLYLLVFKGNEMMNLIHHLYEIAANEA